MLLVATCMIPLSSRAADVYLEPSVSISGGYDENRRLDPEEPDGQTGLELIGEAEAGWRTRTREAVFNAAAHVNRYSDSELDSTDWFLDLDLLRRWRRDEVGLFASYRRASTVTTELEDTGRLRGDRIRKDWTVSPSWTHKLSRRTETTLDYAFTDVMFQDGEANGLFDYREHFIESRLFHRLDRLTGVYGTAEYTRFDSESDTTSDDVSVLVGVERELSRVLTVGAAIGAQYSETDSPNAEGGPARSTDDGFIYEGSAEWTFQRSVLTAEAARSVESSGVGSLSVVDTLSATWTRALTRQWDLNINGSASWREFQPAGGGVSEDRVYYDAEARLEWHGLPRWGVDLSYRYRRQEFDDPGDGAVTEDTADSSAVWLTLRYRWARMDLFR
ncbi:MAG: hypothetical protein U5R46_17935 [Gammaproteobacteria bacterium]|nr:hypothetical protein [Gammaproteobacteria bacterium]